MEKGEYIRTQKGKIGKVADIWKSLVRNETRYLIDWGNGYAHYIAKIKDLKCSKNITSLIEKGDYVNGFKIYNIEYGSRGELVFTIFKTPSNFKSPVKTVVMWEDEDIKSIVTKEQFEGVEFKTWWEDKKW